MKGGSVCVWGTTASPKVLEYDMDIFPRSSMPRTQKWISFPVLLIFISFQPHVDKHYKIGGSITCREEGVGDQKNANLHKAL